MHSNWCTFHVPKIIMKIYSPVEKSPASSPWIHEYIILPFIFKLLDILNKEDSVTILIIHVFFVILNIVLSSLLSSHCFFNPFFFPPTNWFQKLVVCIYTFENKYQLSTTYICIYLTSESFHGKKNQMSIWVHCTLLIMLNLFITKIWWSNFFICFF